MILVSEVFRVIVLASEKGLVKLSLLKWDSLAVKVCREVVHFVIRCNIWLS